MAAITFWAERPMSLTEHEAATGLTRLEASVATLSLQPREAVLQAVREGSGHSSTYWLMNALATVIACYGLLANSAAVVIGAMVVAMLLGPISGVALGLNEGDRPLLRTAARSLVGGILWILAIAVTVGFIHRDAPLTNEILSRTDARLFDLIIALAGGAAGAVAVLSPRVGTAIVGVAVATALMPPLAAAGLLLARAEFELAGGALLLTATNVVAIQLAFSTVFWVGGYRRLTVLGEHGVVAFLRRSLASLLCVSALAVALGFQLHHAITKSLFEGGVHAVLRQHFDDGSGYHLVDVRFAQVAKATIIRAVVRGPLEPSATEVAAVQSDLPSPPNGTTLRLQVRFVPTIIMTSQGPVRGGHDIER
jgi:uncharacterized hydrophobic protein (TIGR00271 family)